LSSLILIGGGPGSGKSTLAASLCKVLLARGQTAIMLDKDELLSDMVDTMMIARGVAQVGQPNRDHPIYWNEIRPLEYAALLDAAEHELKAHAYVVVCAPFGLEFNSASWLPSLTERFSKHTIQSFWLDCSAALALKRVSLRAQPRDHGKLGDWATYLKQSPYAIPSHVEHVLAESLVPSERIERILG
jgi:predicted kinase